MKKNFQKTLILVFEVIVQPPKHTIEIGFFFHVLAHCDIVPYNECRTEDVQQIKDKEARFVRDLAKNQNF